VKSYDPDIDDRHFRQALGCFASGVTVVTSAHAGEIAGTTVSAFASLSLKPPLVLACLDATSATREIIEASRLFAVNVLAEGQGALSDRFSQKRKEGDPHQFDGVAWRAETTGAPILEGAHAYADCRLEAVHEGGDHRIYVGRVVSLGADEARSRPLLYHAGRYHRLGS
jgi:flavin reductase (DIM6/NTAB) family NADH-FMN oxidoreductase RutF